MRNRVHTLAFVLAVIMVGCSGSDDRSNKSNASTAALPTSESTPAFPAPEAIPQLAAACQEADEILTDLSLNNTQTASALRAIDTDDQGLAEVLEETARAFAAGEVEIPDTIWPVCTGEAHGVPELTEDERQFLEDVRSLNPSLEAVGDNDLLISIEFACDGLDFGPPLNRDQLLGFPAPPLPEWEDGVAVLRAGVPIFCSQYQSVVNDLL